MKLSKMLTLLLSLTVTIGLAAACGEKEKTPVTPPPPVNPDTPDTPDDPDKPDTPDDPVSPEDAARLARLGQTPVVAVYFTEYTSSSEFPTLQDVRCFTHINVGHARFKNPKTGDGGLEIKSPGPDYIKKLVAYKKDYPELKVLLFIGGWGKNADGFSEMAKDPDKRALFCSECVRLCKEYGLDGVDLDWEYPGYAAKTRLDDGSYYYNGADPADRANFTILMKDLRAALGDDKLISYAAADNGDYVNNLEVLEWVDYINVMTYSMGDPNPQDPAKQKHNSPLYTSARFNNSRGGADCISIFHDKQGVPYDRLNYGIGFYGHGDGSVYPSSVSYAMAREALEKGTVNGKSVANYNIRWWDEQSKSCFIGNAGGVMYASYEDIESITWRVKFLKEKGMLGAFAWEYREDDSQGTLRKALWALMHDQEPEQPKPSTIPVMEKVEWSKKLQGLGELSGLCLSKDQDFLWGVGDNGQLFKINFDGSYTKHWEYDADMEALCLDPATGDMYMGIEPKRVYKLTYPDYNKKTTLWDVAEAADMGNSGIEGIAWHKGNLYLGSQTGATLWEYKLDGTKLWKKSLRTVCSTVSEIAGLDYDPENDFLWVIDSNSNKDKPQYLPYSIYLFNGDATEHLATYSIASFADWNPESICVDKKNGCVWVADDCGDEGYSILHKIKFSNL